MDDIGCNNLVGVTFLNYFTISCHLYNWLVVIKLNQELWASRCSLRQCTCTVCVIVVSSGLPSQFSAHQDVMWGIHDEELADVYMIRANMSYVVVCMCLSRPVLPAACMPWVEFTPSTVSPSTTLTWARTSPAPATCPTPEQVRAYQLLVCNN